MPSEGASRLQSDLPKKPELFLTWFYYQEHPELLEHRIDAWQHYCESGFAKNFLPHPLFETQFYRETYLASSPDENPLLHYVSAPDRPLSTHPLFDAEFYLSQLTSEERQTKPSNQTWLEYFLENNLTDQKAPSVEFCSRSYVARYADIRNNNLNPLFHYVLHGKQRGRVAVRARKSPPPLFDEEYYRRRNPDLGDIDLWQHYCQHGCYENRDPHPVFHTKFYREKYLAGDQSIDPLEHYIEETRAALDTHPLFDASFYLSQVDVSVEELAGEGLTPLEHFLKHNREHLASPSPLFSSKKYLENNRDLATSTGNLLHNYLSFGYFGGRLPFLDTANLEVLRFRSEYELKLMEHFKVPHQDFVLSMASKPVNKTVVIVSHEASRTGAPLIILKIAEEIRAKFAVDVVTILGRGGELQERFELLGPTINLDGSTPWGNDQDFRHCVAIFHALIERQPLIGAIVNSAESRHLLPELAKLNIPVHSLVHENARAYEKGQFEDIAKFSDRVVFPSNYVKKAALENTSFRREQIDVLPQGLLNESLLEIDSDSSGDQLRDQLDIPRDATLVLGCGTQDGRKGIDLFISTAIIAKSKAPTANIVFAWLGHPGRRQNVDYGFWVDRDIETAGIEDMIRFIPPTDDVAPFFEACDMLFLSSRMDPFPCVVNEAMASSKPIVLFEGGSGCVDLLKHQGGGIVPYANVNVAAETILELSKYPELRKQMGERNRQYVAENMAFDDYVNQLVEGLVCFHGQSEIYQG